MSVRAMVSMAPPSRADSSTQVATEPTRSAAIGRATNPNVTTRPRSVRTTSFRRRSPWNTFENA